MRPRALQFAVVGAGGFVIQLSALGVLTSLGWHYAFATIAAVELAVLQNFWWHERWTWIDRRDPAGWRGRLAKFHLSNATASLLGNLVFTALFVEAIELPAVVANGIAVGLTAVLNYALADRWVFPLGVG